MKINIANPPLSLQKTVEVEDENKLLNFLEKRIGAEVPADTLGDEFKGYVLRITGGNDKQGFPMKQGVLKNGRVKLLFKKGMSCYSERRGGMRKRKSVRGCIVGHDIAILSTVLVKKGDSEIEGLTDTEKPRRLGPKRASKIRKMFDIEKADGHDMVKKFVIRREVKAAEGGKKAVTKAPKIQRLVTASRVQRKRRVRKTMVKAIQRNREEFAAYKKSVAEHSKKLKEKKALSVSKKNKKKAQKA